MKYFLFDILIRLGELLGTNTWGPDESERFCLLSVSHLLALCPKNVQLARKEACLSALPTETMSQHAKGTLQNYAVVNEMLFP